MLKNGIIQVGRETSIMDLQEAYMDAWLFAGKAHSDQLMPGTQLPYIVHIGMVANEIMCADRIEQVPDMVLAIQVALLHDVIEDTTITTKEIRNIFSDAVASGVQALTKSVQIHKDEAMAKSIEEILAQPKEIGMVKLADRITNLRPPPACWSKDKVASYHNESILIYDKLQHVHNYLALRLGLKIQEYRKHF